MAPCIIIGERAGQMLQSRHGLQMSLPAGQTRAARPERKTSTRFHAQSCGV
jgi:hypothetical protein